MIYTILMVSAVVLSILIIFFILMQKGKGDASGMFGEAPQARSLAQAALEASLQS